MGCLTPWDLQTARVFDTDGAWHSLFANSDKSGLARDAVLIIRQRTSSRVAEDCHSRKKVQVSCYPSVGYGNGLFTVGAIDRRKKKL